MLSRSPGTGPGAVRIRRAVARDAKRLTRIVRASRAYEGPYAPMIAGYRVGPDYIEAHRVFVAVAGGFAPDAGSPPDSGGCGAAGGPDGSVERVLGFYALVLDPIDPPELDLMFVSDAAQGRGIGRRLVAHLRGEARAAGVDEVRVVAHPPAEGFYLGVGAERTGTVLARPPAVMWDRPEMALTIAPE
ncbi:GNAT family N-acetyltransferase [Streptomyces sp. A5-4]|uniref:GNAT family N-acetyltransferase n=1 Tax=Streptomyces sp. A5-4 TaxID=3384771 RepID=UPI003DA85CC2